MTELEYWKLKAQLGALTVEEMGLSSRLVEVNRQKNSLIKEAGFNPDKNYQWNDSKCEIEEIKDANKVI